MEIENYKEIATELSSELEISVYQFEYRYIKQTKISKDVKDLITSLI